MKMTLPFKPHVLALICSAGLCAASAGLYIKSRTVEAPVEAQSTQLTVSDAAAVTLPATVSAPPVTPAVVKSAFNTAQIDQWVAPVALYPDSLLSQVLMASTYPTNVAQAVQWSHDNPLKQGDAAIQAVSDQPWDASVKSLVAFPQLMALMGENPQWVQNLGDAFLAQPQDVMDSVQRLRQLAQQTGSLKSSTEQKVITTTKKTVPVTQTVTAPVIPSNTVLTANHVITEPATTVISIEPANPDVVYIPNYNPTVVYGNWANTAYPPVYLPPPAGEPFVDSFVRGFGYSMGVATTYALFSSIDWDDDDHDHHHHDDDECCCGHDHDHEHHHHHDHDDDCCCGHDHDHEQHHDHDEDEEHEHHHHHDHDDDCCCGHDHDHEHHHHHHADEVFTSWGMETIVPVTKDQLEDILKRLAETKEFGDVLRAKGMLPTENPGEWLYFDLVPEQYEIRDGKPDYTGKVCVIGASLKEEELNKVFGRG